MFSGGELREGMGPMVARVLVVTLLLVSLTACRGSGPAPAVATTTTPSPSRPAAATPVASPTLPLPVGCDEAAILGVVHDFIAAFNAGDQAGLARFFPAKGSDGDHLWTGDPNQLRWFTLTRANPSKGVDALPHAAPGPATEPLVDRLALAKALGQVAPGDARPEAVERRLHEQPVVRRRPAHRPGVPRQQLRDPRPLVVPQPVPPRQPAPLAVDLPSPPTVPPLSTRPTDLSGRTGACGLRLACLGGERKNTSKEGAPMRGPGCCRHSRRMPPWGRHILRGAFTCGMLVLLTACSASPSEAPTPSSVEATAHCFGWTARLTLVQAAGDGASSPATPSSAVSGTQWQLTVEGPTALAIDDEVTASLDTFTIRGEQASRRDLALVRWSGSAQSLTAQGAVLLPEVEGTIREDDRGRILAWIRTPSGYFGVEGLTFRLRPEGTGVTILNPAPLPQEQCPDS